MIKLDVWSRGSKRALLGALLVVALAACGGGGGSAGEPVIGPGSGASGPSGAASAVAADLVVVLSKTTMTNSGADSVTATVTSIDANRVVVGSVPVSFTVDAKAVVTPAGTATDAKTGVLSATITQGDDSTVRPVTVTVTSGAISRTVSFSVVQSSSTTNPQANDLTLSLSATNIDNSGSKTVIATATAVDANRNALAGIPVQLSVLDASAFLAPAPSNQTNANGQVTGTVNIGADRSNRPVTVVATSGTLTRTVAFQVTGAQFSQASPVPAVVAAGAAGTVQYTLTDVNSIAMAGVPISVSGSGVVSATAKTNLNGSYTFPYTAPNAPGTNLTITALAGGVESIVVVAIPGGGSTTVPVAAVPVAKTLNLSADVVAVNTGTTGNQVTVNAFFRDANNVPVPNVRVLFGVTGDNQTGTIGSGRNTVLSDASGTASTTYSPGAVSSPTNGVTVQACWKRTDFAPTDTPANCTAAGGELLTTTLTIVSNPVSISIGTDNTLTDGASGLTYVKKYVILVVDSAGNPKSDVQITPSLDLGGYGKGYWVYNTVSKKWERKSDFGTVGLLAATCPNEDLNRNGVIDTGEDINGNKQLDSRKSDVAITLLGATKTDANGIAVLQVEYPKSLASWVSYKITVTAAGVLSPPAYYPLGVPVSLPSKSANELGSATAVTDYLYTYVWLPVAADAIAAEGDPSFKISPYGISDKCTEAK
ncbi:hypothetical protein [Roseateles sp.]|uniref:hypothetical protein n=1 Tax=Roseateles sp. TaxID=1971397 RepID=UPI003262FE80